VAVLQALFQGKRQVYLFLYLSIGYQALFERNSYIQTLIRQSAYETRLVFARVKCWIHWTGPHYFSLFVILQKKLTKNRE